MLSASEGVRVATVSDAVSKDLLEFTKQETGVKKDFVLRDIADYSFVRQINSEIG